MCVERRAYGRDEREQARLRARAIGLGREQRSADRGDGYGSERKHACELIGGPVEEVRRVSRRHEHTDGRKPEIDQPERMQSCIAEPTREREEDKRLRRPGKRERGVREQVSRSDRCERERGDTDCEPEIRQTPRIERGEHERPDRSRGEQGGSTIAALVEELERQHHRCRERDERVRQRERVELGLPGDELSSDTDREQGEDEERCDEERPWAGRRDRLGSEPLDLEADDDGDRDEQRMPRARNGRDRRRHENDRREGGRFPRQVRVERLEPWGERRAEQGDAGDDLRAPANRDRRTRRRDQPGERKRECVGYEIEADRRSCKGRVRARDAGSDRGERRPVLPVACSQHQSGREHECGRGRAERNPHAFANPAAIGCEDEEEPDAERHDGAAHDREAARADEIPVLGELTRRATRRTGRFCGRRRRNRRRPRRCRLRRSVDLRRRRHGRRSVNRRRRRRLPLRGLRLLRDDERAHRVELDAELREAARVHLETVFAAFHRALEPLDSLDQLVAFALVHARRSMRRSSRSAQSAELRLRRARACSRARRPECGRRRPRRCRGEARS